MLLKAPDPVKRQQLVIQKLTFGSKISVICYNTFFGGGGGGGDNDDNYLKPRPYFLYLVYQKEGQFDRNREIWYLGTALSLVNAHHIYTTLTLESGNKGIQLKTAVLLIIQQVNIIYNLQLKTKI